jgi:LmbE family N-acetylglucosaminyl deacetylase
MSARFPLARVLLVCPHPDDETLGAGLLLQEVVARGGQVRVLYLTDGERNPIPQLLEERRWPFGPAARARWGARRRAEAREALRILGVEDGAAEHWSLPDQGLAHLADGDRVVASLSAAFESFAPTVIVTPSARDLHPDHVAAASLVRRAMAKSGQDIAHLVYRVHGGRPSLDDAYVPPASLPTLNRKSEAMNAHATQLVASRRRMLHLATRPEALWSWETDIRHGAQSWRGLRRLMHLLPIWTASKAEWDEGTVASVPLEES